MKLNHNRMLYEVANGVLEIANPTDDEKTALDAYAADGIVTLPADNAPDEKRKRKKDVS